MEYVREMKVCIKRENKNVKKSKNSVNGERITKKRGIEI